jgi:hypothetical protein
MNFHDNGLKAGFGRMTKDQEPLHCADYLNAGMALCIIRFKQTFATMVLLSNSYANKAEG